MKIKIFSCLMLLMITSNVFSNENKYAVLTLNGSVNPIVAEYLVDALKKASDDGNKFVIIQMDTPGGLMDSMRDIIKSILTSTIPVVVYTFPKGAQAASAGGFIMLASHIAAMAPGTEIGAMHPVSPMLDFMKKDKDGGPEGVMEKKVLNDTIAYARSLAQKRGRNVDWAVEAVSKAISNSYMEAYKAGVIDIIAEDMPDLIRQLDGRKIDMNGSDFIFRTKGIIENRYEMTWKQKFVNRFADPQMIFLLFIIAIAGIGLELKNPGMIVPGTVGGIALILFLLGIKIIPINALGLVLVILAFVMFILELKFQSFGLLTAGGVVSFFIGATILFDSPLPGGGIPMSSIIAMIAVVLAFVFIVVRAVINVHKTQVTTGREGMIGETGTALNDFSKNGKISIHGEIWNAESDIDIKQGDSVIVEEVNGMVLKVKVKQ
ncbi:MAG TPA: nodulation protein NfeD [Spirochaetota bacterium]|nr:nodulation protein NfeD [Spirochaetota bacterium]HPS85336.1 nodulation protein NfeD [Spirochaetota bacterium]